MKPARSIKKTNRKYLSYQLVEAFRTAKGPRQRILLTIGSEVILSAIERKELANRIEDLIQGVRSLYPSPQHIESLAQHFAKLLLQNHSQAIEEALEEEAEYHTVDLHSVRHTDVRSIGCEYIAHSAYCELGFDGLFRQLRLSEKQRLAAAATIIGRAVHPSMI